MATLVDDFLNYDNEHRGDMHMRKLPTHSRENCAKAFTMRLARLFELLGDAELFWEFQLDAPPCVGYVLGVACHEGNQIAVEVEGNGGKQLRKFRLTVECIEAAYHEPEDVIES